MDFICSKSDWVSSVRLASHALGPRSSMPILGGLKLAVQGSRLRLCATDLERAVRCEIAIENSDGDSSVVLNGTVVSQIAAHLPEDEKVSIQTDPENDTVVKLRCGEASFDLPTLPVEDYPEIPELPSGKIAALDVPALRRALEQTAFAALKAGETTRLSLTGVDIVLEGGSVKLVATNGYRLAMKTSPAAEIHEEGEFLIEAGVLGGLDRVLTQTGADHVDIHKGEGRLFFQAAGVTFVAKTIGEEFPDFERVIPKENPITLLFDRKALLDTLQRMEITAAEESGAVTLRATTEESAVQLTSSSKDKGEADERVRLKRVPEEDIEVSFKAEYVIDAVKRMDSEQIGLWLSTGEKAGLIEPTGDSIAPSDEGFLYVCMPVRLSS
ncbi:MAG: DNA polymerase III subunit beta [Candidatus Bipolaricaulota bacterium]|nr:MAG: DNA polymerase III subunit beta [Candidatus Bipolaricaulota bacterium]